MSDLSTARWLGEGRTNVAITIEAKLETCGECGWSKTESQRKEFRIGQPRGMLFCARVGQDQFVWPNRQGCEMFDVLGMK